MGASADRTEGGGRSVPRLLRRSHMRRAFRFVAFTLAVAVAGLAGAAGAHAMPADAGAGRILAGQDNAPRSVQACPPTCTSDVGSGDQTLPGPPGPGTHDGPPGPP